MPSETRQAIENGKVADQNLAGRCIRVYLQPAEVAHEWQMNS